MQELMKGVKGGFAGITSRFDCYKPFIAAVNGLAMGGGFEIALACDVIIASDNAFFSLPEPRVGLIPGARGVHRLPRQIPYHLAMNMIMTSKRVTSREAMQYGIVAEVVPLADLMRCRKIRRRNTQRCTIMHPGLQGSDSQGIDRYPGRGHDHHVSGAAGHVPVRGFH